MSATLDMVRLSGRCAANAVATHFGIALDQEDEMLARDRVAAMIENARQFALQANEAACERVVAAETKVG